MKRPISYMFMAQRIEPNAVCKQIYVTELGIKYAIYLNDKKQMESCRSSKIAWMNYYYEVFKQVP